MNKDKLMDELQKETPFVDALEKYTYSNCVPFDVPGHKLGSVETELSNKEFGVIYKYDCNAPRGLDNLNHPHGVIEKAEDLAAKAFGSEKAYFLVNGCSEAIHVMLMSCLCEDDHILIPRNAHKSVINALILSGATPIFMDPDLDKEYGIAKSLSFESVKRYIDDNPFAKAILLIYPTYFGEVCDLKSITEYAHSKGLIVLVDEAHGSHFKFCSDLPISAIECGADLVASSLHKTGLSLTQSSILLKQGNRVDESEIRTSINILQSTSPSSLFIASIDAARKALYFDCDRLMHQVLEYGKEFREKCKSLKHIQVLNKEHFINNGSFNYDESKLILSFKDLNLSGVKVYQILKDKYNIQAELGEQLVILFILSSGTKKEHLDKLFDAIKDIDNTYEKSKTNLPEYKYHYPKQIVKPRIAFEAIKEDVLLEDSYGLVAAEQIMIYPPGIPLIIPGEQIDEVIIKTINDYISNECLLLKDSPEKYIRVVKKEK